MLVVAAPVPVALMAAMQAPVELVRVPVARTMETEMAIAPADRAMVMVTAKATAVAPAMVMEVAMEERAERAGGSTDLEVASANLA